MRTEAGFTLVEILAGGVISTVLAGAMLSLFYLVTGNIRDSAANSRLLRIQTIAEDQLRRSIRKAYGAKLSQNEPSLTTNMVDITTIAAEDPGAHAGRTQIWLYQADPDGLIDAYQISADTLMELKNGVFRPMIVGTDTVRLVAAGNSFSVFPNRQGIALALRYRIQENGIADSTPPIIDSVLCRGKI